ncbi:SpoVR family protein [Blastopirellula sp. J2-11]|uniref:SpoVR family protein n=1 Tax=Blastopirellula sp. J2-11 TaxID=2943192 RepID=UPI0021C7B9E0|nr:SpoVR family protein [Blastopirellula sp. J2-11]UUO04469.1 SpoVR family protein [Blastopirellula sp. J2-11]
MPITSRTFANLPAELVDVQLQMEDYAAGYGLDFFPTIFELVNVDQLNAIAAYGGFPTRYPHWRFGMEYEKLARGYHYGLQKIYELVINNDPCYAYLLASNEFADHKLVMAHVYGHCDFFKCNYWFSQTNRKMIDNMANHGNRIRRYMDRFGVEEVENFIDNCLSIEDLIDIHSPFIRRYAPDEHNQFKSPTDSVEADLPQSRRLPAKGYMESFINPTSRGEEDPLALSEAKAVHAPAEPMKDVMLFLLQFAPLKQWQLDVLSIIRDEAYYFAPQGQTKIMNEGWATYWHSTIMTRHGLNASEVISYADHTSGTLATSPSRLNPYKLGLELLRDVEDRWNRGCFGSDYDDCDDMRARAEWDKQLGLGREKIFEVRKVHNDLTFIDEFLTLEFCQQNKLFQFGYNKHADYYEIESREFPKVKQQLLHSLTNMGRPEIYVKDGNYKNRNELYLQHRFQGVELKLNYAHDTLKNLYALWRRPVHIETALDEYVAIISFDGTNHEIKKTEEKAIAPAE